MECANMSHDSNKFWPIDMDTVFSARLSIRNQLVEEEKENLSKNCPIIWEFHFHKMLFGENADAIVVAAAAADDDEPVISFSFES